MCSCVLNPRGNSVSGALGAPSRKKSGCPGVPAGLRGGEPGWVRWDRGREPRDVGLDTGKWKEVEVGEAREGQHGTTEGRVHRTKARTADRPDPAGSLARTWRLALVITVKLFTPARVLPTPVLTPLRHLVPTWAPNVALCTRILWLKHVCQYIAQPPSERVCSLKQWELLTLTKGRSWSKRHLLTLNPSFFID